MDSTPPSSMPPPSSSPPGWGAELHGSAEVQRAAPPPSPGRGGLSIPKPLLAVVGVLIAAAAAFLLIGLPGGSPGGPLNPIAEAAQRTVDSGLRFSGTGTALADGASVQVQFQGGLDGEQNRSMMEMQMQVSGAQSPSTSMDIVQDGMTTYMSSPLFSGTLPGGVTWMKMDFSEVAPEAAAQAETVDTRGMLESLEAVAPDIRSLGDERVRGVKTTHYAATIDSAPIEVWIDGHDLIRQMTMTAPLAATGGPAASMQMTIYFYDFGQAPAIAVPADDQVFDATELGEQALAAQLG